MFAIRAGAAFVVGAMLAAIVGATSTGDLASEGPALVALPWGRVTLIDAYLAFGLGWAWIVARERTVPAALGWLVAVLATGSLALGAYTLGAAVRARNVPELLLGPRVAATPRTPCADG